MSRRHHVYHPGSGDGAWQHRAELRTVRHLSHEARDAESRGFHLISRAVPEVARLAGCQHRVARAALEQIGSSESHWVGSRRLQYFDVSAAVDVVRRAQTKPG